MDERAARMALSCVVEPGTGQVSALVEDFGAGDTWTRLLAGSLSPAWARRARALALEGIVEAAARHRIRFIVPGDDEWPESLACLAGCEPVQQMGGVPFGLWVRGGRSLREVLVRSVAVVGSRASTPYGDSTASGLAADLGAAGFTVVSGGAFGIDAASHRGALAVGGLTVSVMAGGLDALYPPGNAALLSRVAAEGLLVSELPPGAHPTRMRFLARNRLIAALAQGTVLVEAALRSGARNTVTWANACGRPVMAVPGPVHSALSVTPHRLIREAEAVLVTSAAEIAELLGPLGQRSHPRADVRRPWDDLSAGELAVFEALPARLGMAAGEISLRSGVPLSECLGILECLAERGLAVEAGVGWRLDPAVRSRASADPGG